MILVDTSIWVDHYRQPSTELVELLSLDRVAQHAFVTLEMALGNPKNRDAMVAQFESLEQAVTISQAGMLSFVRTRNLGGTGIGFVDAHLLASASRMNGKLWSSDKRLAAQAARLGLAYEP